MQKLDTLRMFVRRRDEVRKRDGKNVCERKRGEMRLFVFAVVAIRTWRLQLYTVRKGCWSARESLLLLGYHHVHVYLAHNDWYQSLCLVENDFDQNWSEENRRKNV